MANCNEVMMEHSQKATKPGLCYLLQWRYSEWKCWYNFKQI
jgi:hypothetical protein